MGEKFSCGVSVSMTLVVAKVSLVDFDVPRLASMHVRMENRSQFPRLVPYRPRRFQPSLFRRVPRVDGLLCMVHYPHVHHASSPTIHAAMSTPRRMKKVWGVSGSGPRCNQIDRKQGRRGEVVRSKEGVHLHACEGATVSRPWTTCRALVFRWRRFACASDAFLRRNVDRTTPSASGRRLVASVVAHSPAHHHVWANWWELHVHHSPHMHGLRVSNMKRMERTRRRKPRNLHVITSSMAKIQRLLGTSCRNTCTCTTAWEEPKKSSIPLHLEKS